MKHLKQFIHHMPASAIYDEYDSPIGLLTLISSSQGLHRILWDIDREDEECDDMIKALRRNSNDSLLLQTKQQLEAYFQGKKKSFTILLSPQGTTFQQLAWKVLQEIPYGSTISYGEQATILGNKNKARAVGIANGANPISIIIPCHRVIGQNGKLTGFGGGLDKKAWLLAHENKYKQAF